MYLRCVEKDDRYTYLTLGKDYKVIAKGKYVPLYNIKDDTGTLLRTCVGEVDMGLKFEFVTNKTR